MWDHLVSSSGRAAKVLGKLWTRWRERRAAMAELAYCPQDEVNRMASEFGLSAGELRDLVAKGSDAADLLAKRLQALGIAPDDAALKEMRKDLERCCSFCESKRSARTTCKSTRSRRHGRSTARTRRPCPRWWR